MTAFPRRAAVLGHPAGQSLSPVVHGHWLRHYGIDGSYVSLDVAPAALAATLRDLAAQGYAGCNLTMPHKQAALALMDECDAASRAAGAVNTVVMRDGRLFGYNSDGFGFIASLSAQVPHWSRRHVVMLGAGGAARGLVPALQAAGVRRITLVNRTLARAQQVADDFPALEVDVAPWDARHAALHDAALLVNATSLGMAGGAALDLDLSGLPDTAAVADLVYRPLVTPLLAQAQARALATADGLTMLLHQARLGFYHWFGVDPAVTPALAQDVRAAMKGDA